MKWPTKININFVANIDYNLRYKTSCCREDNSLIMRNGYTWVTRSSPRAVLNVLTRERRSGLVSSLSNNAARAGERGIGPAGMDVSRLPPDVLGLGDGMFVSTSRDNRRQVAGEADKDRGGTGGSFALSVAA